MNVKVLVEHSVKVRPCGTLCHRDCPWWTIHSNGNAVCDLFVATSGKSRKLRQDEYGRNIRLAQCIGAGALALVVSA